MKPHHRPRGHKGPKKPFFKRILPIVGGFLGAAAGLPGIILGSNIGKGLAQGQGLHAVTSALEKQDILGIAGDKFQKVEDMLTGKDGQRDKVVQEAKKEAQKAVEESISKNIFGKRSIGSSSSMRNKRQR